MASFVGIDLGTTNSVVARRERVRPAGGDRQPRGGEHHAVGDLLRHRPAGGRPGGQGVGPAGRRRDRQLLQAAHGQPALPAPLPRQDYDATDLSAIVLEAAQGRRRGGDRRARSTGPSSPCRPTSATPSARRRIDAGRRRRARGAPDHQRADRRGARLRPEQDGRRRRDGPDLRPRRRHVRRDRRPDRRPRRSPCWPPPATTTSAARTGTTGSPRSWPSGSRRDRLRPARRPRRSQRGPRPQRAGQVGALGTRRRPASRFSSAPSGGPSRSDPRRVRGDDLPPDGPDPKAHRGGAGRGRPVLAAARRRPAGRRLDPDADGPLVRHQDGRQGRPGPG